MPLPSQLKKLETILHIYAAGDAHLVEGLKLTFMALVSLVAFSLFRSALFHACLPI